MNRLAKSVIPALVLAAVAVVSTSFVDVTRVALAASVVLGVMLLLAAAEISRKLDEVSTRVEGSLATTTSLPDSATALAKAAAGLATLETTLPASHRAAIDEIRAALTTSVATIERSLVGSATALETNAKESRVALEANATSVRAALEAHATSTRTALEANSKAGREAVEAAGAANRQVVESGAKASRDALESSAKSMREAVEAGVAANRDLFTTTAAEQTAALDGTAKAIASALEASSRDLGSRLDTTSVGLAKSIESLATDLPARALAALAPEAARAIATATEASTQHLAEVRKVQVDETSRIVAALEAKLAVLAADFGDAVTAVRAQATADGERSRSETEKVSELLTRLGATASEVGESAGLQLGTIDKLVAATEARLAASDEASANRLASVVDKLDGLIASDRERSVALDEALRASAARTAEDVATLLGQHAKGLGDELAKTQSLVHEAAGLVHAGGAELSSLAQTFADAVDKYRAASDEWLANLGAMEASVVSAGEHAASDVLGQQLARTHEIFDRQLRFQSELLDRLRATRNEPAPAPTVGPTSTMTDELQAEPSE